MKDCKNCAYEKGGMICLQGHVRKTKYENLQSVGHFPAEDCHAWKEKAECWWCKDWEVFEEGYKGMTTYEVVKKLIGLSPDKPECPICAKKL